MIYLHEEMVRIGLKEGQQFPSEEHRIFSVNLCIGNPFVSDADILTEIVQYICTIPNSDITSILPWEMPIEIQFQVYGHVVPPHFSFDEVKEFLALARRFRATPIVDDDFPLMRDRFDRKLTVMLNKLESMEKHLKEQAELDEV